MSHMLHVTCQTCYMSHVKHVTCHKYQVSKKFTKDPVCYIFLESSCKNQFNCRDKYVTCHMSHMLHVTNIKLQRILPNSPCVIYFWKVHTKFSSMVMIKISHDTYVTYMLHVTNIKLQRS